MDHAHKENLALREKIVTDTQNMCLFHAFVGSLFLMLVGGYTNEKDLAAYNLKPF